MRELNVAEMEEVSGGTFLLLGSLVLGALSGLADLGHNWGGNNGGGNTWGGNSWGGNNNGGSSCGCGTTSFPAGNGGWVGGSFNDVLNNIIHSS